MHLEFSEVSVCWEARLLQVSDFWLRDFALCNLLVADLNGVVAVFFQSLQLRDLVAAVERNDCAARSKALRSEDLSHACLRPEDSDTCLNTACDCAHAASTSLTLWTAAVKCLHKGNRPASHEAAAGARRHLCAGSESSVHTGLHSDDLCPGTGICRIEPMPSSVDQQATSSKKWSGLRDHFALRPSPA